MSPRIASSTARSTEHVARIVGSLALERDELAAAGDPLLDGQRAEDRAHHQPGDALGQRRPIVAAAREARAPASRRPRLWQSEPITVPRRGRRGSRPGRGCSRRPAPRTRSSASWAASSGVPAAAAEHAQRAEAEQRPRRPAAAELERVLERPPALGAVDARRPEAPERRRQPQQQLAVVRLSVRMQLASAMFGYSPSTRARNAGWLPVRDSASSRSASPAVQAACRSHPASSSPADSSSSRPNSRIVSSIQKRGSPSESWRWRRRLFWTSESSPSNSSSPKVPSKHTASAASRRQP